MQKQKPASLPRPPPERERGDKYKFKGGNGARDALNRTEHTQRCELRQDKTSVSCVRRQDKPAVGYLLELWPAVSEKRKKPKRDPQKGLQPPWKDLFQGASFLGALELPAGSQLCMRTSWA